MKKVILAPKHTAFGDHICGFSNLISLAEKYNEDIVVYAPVTWGVSSRSRLFSLIKQPKRGSLHLFQYVEHPGGVDHGGVGIEKSQYLVQLMGFNESDIFTTRPLVETEYLEFDLSKLDTSGNKIKIPKKPYLTVQYDASSENRQWSKQQKKSITQYYQSLGYPLVSLGGWDTGLADKHNGIDIMVDIMSKAEGHVGVDSALAHMALCLKKPCHVYSAAANATGLRSLHKHGAKISHPDNIIGNIK